MMAHTTVNVLGTPVRAKSKRKRREGTRERFRRKNQRERERRREGEKGGLPGLPPCGYMGCSLCKDAGSTEGVELYA